MWLEGIMEDDFIAEENIYILAVEDGVDKAEVKRQKNQLGVKSIKVEFYGQKVWLWFLPDRIFKQYEFWANE